MAGTVTEKNISGLDQLFAGMWTDYTSFNPHARVIYDQILAREQKSNAAVKALINDHIALRTFDVASIDLEQMARIFLKYGYQACGEYEFKEKKLFAKHYEHNDPRQPKVFISHLLTSEFSPKVRAIAESVARTFTDEDMQRDEVLFSGRRWAANSKVYRELLEESEYAAWLYAFGFRCNHFTVSFNDLKSFKDLSDLNAFVRSIGQSLNTSGGEIKGTPNQLLEQSSTLAGQVELEFDDTTLKIPACYYEFARRYAKPDGQLYTGFIAASADKIFESTNVKSARV